MNPDPKEETGDDDNLYSNNDFAGFEDFMFDINNIDQLNLNDQNNDQGEGEGEIDHDNNLEIEEQQQQE